MNRINWNFKKKTNSIVITTKISKHSFLYKQEQKILKQEFS